MSAGEFPVRDDVPAFLLVDQLAFRRTARPSDPADTIQVS
ncbi:hypothetical protein SAMN05216489_00570 [Streptomyces sp. 3213]|nr:hypothetical protein SAMN05216489_00570 [Streptomyces sp. 3213] [Streptomyces sp. 3213.3]